MLHRLTNGNAVFQPLHYQIYSVADSKVTVGKTFSVRVKCFDFSGRTYYKLLEEEFPGLPPDVSKACFCKCIYQLYILGFFFFYHVPTNSVAPFSPSVPLFALM